jgi:hypothetical protein
MWKTTFVTLSNADDIIFMHNIHVSFTDSFMVGFYMRQPIYN